MFIKELFIGLESTILIC